MRKPTARLWGPIAILCVTGTGNTAPGVDQQVGVAVETVENTVDGSELRGCLTREDLVAGKRHEAWIAFGAVNPRAGSGWEAVAARTDCGSGAFDKAGAPAVRTFGTPYLIVDLALVAAVLPAGGVSLDTSFGIRKLSGFDRAGRPTYTAGAQKRVIDLGTSDQAVVPLLIADQREQAAFGLHELFLRLGARVPGREVPAAYGAVSVTADVPGISIFLDGGLAGRTTEGRPTVLTNVLTGPREVRVRDFSGREARKSVVVGQGRTAAVAFDMLRLSGTATKDLLPIGKNPQGFEEFWRVRDAAIVAMVLAGEFVMGSPEGQGEAAERPQRRLHGSEFLIDKTEVTWRQFRKFAQATGAALPPEPLWGTADEYPVVNVRWNEAIAYCEWVGGRLPSEAEWEKAARGTDGRKYPWGEEWDLDRCNSWDGGPHRPEPAGSFPDCVSPYGAMDMAGSVWEWCADLFVEPSQAETPPKDPSAPAAAPMRALRGGSWLSQPNFLRAAYRFRNAPGDQKPHNGFRCVQDAPK